MALLKDTDLFLVSDDKDSYKISKADLKSEIGGSQVIIRETPPDPTDLEEGTLWWDNSGDDARLYILYNDSVSGEIWVDASPPGAGGGGGGGTVDVLDDIGDVSVAGAILDDVLAYDGTNWVNRGGNVLAGAPVINQVVLSEVEDSNSIRFTNQEFNVDLDMFILGEPTSMKGIKGTVTAQFATYHEAEILENVVTATPNAPMNDFTCNLNVAWPGGEYDINTHNGVLTIPVEDSHWGPGYYQFITCDYHRGTPNESDYVKLVFTKDFINYVEIHKKDSIESNIQSYAKFGDWFIPIQAPAYRKYNSKGYNFAWKRDPDPSSLSGIVKVELTGNTGSYASNWDICYDNMGCFYKYALLNNSYTIYGSKRYDDAPTSKYLEWPKGYKDGQSINGMWAYPAQNGNTYIHIALESQKEVGVIETWKVVDPTKFDEDRIERIGSINTTTSWGWGGYLGLGGYSEGCFAINRNKESDSAFRFDHVTESWISAPITVGGQVFNRHTYIVFNKDGVLHAAGSVKGEKTIRLWKSMNHGVTWQDSGMPPHEVAPSKPATDVNSYQRRVSQITSKFGQDIGSAWFTSTDSGNPSEGPYYYERTTIEQRAKTTTAALSNFSEEDGIVLKTDEYNTIYMGLIDSLNYGDGTFNIRTTGEYQVGDIMRGSAVASLKKSTRYLKFDIGGNVESTLSADPGFVILGDQTNFDLKFPASFATGKSPDSELPPGTILQVEMSAQNIVNQGNPNTKLSNTVTPA